MVDTLFLFLSLADSQNFNALKQLTSSNHNSH